MKKVFLIFLGLCILFAFSACSSKNTESSNTTTAPSSTQTTVPVGNTLTYEDVSYKVNPLLSSNEKIDYVDIAESDDKSVTGIEIGWESFNADDADGCKDILLMYYSNTLTEVKKGNQTILGSVYIHRSGDFSGDFEEEYSYYDAYSNLICKATDTDLYDKNGSLIATWSDDDNAFYDLHGNIFDAETLDPFIKTVNNVDLDF